MTPLIALAESLIVPAHAGQVDKAGRDYITGHLRPISKALAPFGPTAMAGGLIHDIVEDTDETSPINHTPRTLLEAGVPWFLVNATMSVTRRTGEPYLGDAGLLGRARRHPLGRIIKLADGYWNLICNPDLARTDPAKADSLLNGRYRPGQAYLLDGIDESFADIEAMRRSLEESLANFRAAA